MKLLEDGRYEHTMRQSWMNTYFTCPEQARLVLNNEYPPDETEAAAKGTGTHAAIEAVLLRCAEPDEAIAEGVKVFREIAAKPEFRWVQVKTEKTALAHLEGGFYSWYDYVYPTLGATTWIEKRFKFVIYEDEKRVIYLSGTIDYGDRKGLKDWKLTGNQDKYGRDGWQQTRWACQPTTYAAAAYELGLFPRDVAVPFEFVALSPYGRAPQLCPADRTWGHVEWLKRQVVSIARHIEDEAPIWPLRDQHALCSAKWCLNYASCKGAMLAA